MAEFCSMCTPFNDKNDFDLFRIALYLKKGHSVNFLCEGCSNRALYKDENGNLYLAKQGDKKLNMHPVLIEELVPKITG